MRHPTTTTPTRGMRQIEARLGQPIGDWLRHAYIVRGLSTTAIAAELGVDRATVSRYMAAVGVEARHTGWTRGGQAA